VAKLSALLIEKNQAVCEKLTTLCAQSQEFELISCCDDVEKAARQIIRQHPQVLFLGPGTSMLDGFRLIGMLNEVCVPQVVFLTPPDHDVLKGLEQKQFDYLLTPVDLQQLTALKERLHPAFTHSCETPGSVSPLVRIPCSCGHRIKLIPPEAVEYIHSDASGVHVFTEEGAFFTELTLKALEQQLGLFRSHKQYLLNLKVISELVLQECGQAEIRTGSGHHVPVSRRYLRGLKQAFQL